MAEMTFDLQSHSRHSDGALAPAEVVQRAAAAGLSVLALTDHDTVAGVAEALDAAAAAGIEVVPAVEVSAIHGGYEDLHILGYRVDHRSPDLLRALESFRADRARRADRMADALAEIGLHLDERVLDAQRAAGGPIGRPHLARAVWEEPRNAQRLAAEGLTRPEEVLQAYLLPGQPGYRGRTIPTVPAAIDVIHRAGGVAIWAHPFWDIKDADEVVATLRELAGQGLDGVEAFYVTHTPEQTRRLDDESRRLGLLSTGSSDFHGPDHSIFSRFSAYELHGREPRPGPVLGR